MIEIDRKILCFKKKEIWFSPGPFDVKGYDHVTFHFCSQASSLPGFQMAESNTFGIDLNRDLNVIWEQLDQTTRHQITRARQNGVKVRVNQDYEEFMELNRRFRESKELHRFQVPMEEMKRHGVLFVSFIDDKMQGGQLYLEDDKNMRQVISVSRRLEVDKDQGKYIGYGNKLLVWEAICHAKKAGKVFFDLGGYSDEPQLLGAKQFKAGFSKDVYKSYKYNKTYNKAFDTARGFYRFLKRIKI